MGLDGEYRELVMSVGRGLLVAFLYAGILLVSSTASAVVEIDEPVEDRADVLDETAERALGARLREHHRKTGVQMAILTVDTTGGEPIEDFSLRVAEAWGGGTAGEDRGLLLTLAIADRRSRLEVGYGLEHIVTDARSKRALDAMRPYLRRGDYYDALDHATDWVVAMTGGMVAGQPIPDASTAERSMPGVRLDHPRVLIAMTFAVPLLLVLLSMGIRRWRGESRIEQPAWLRWGHWAAQALALSVIGFIVATTLHPLDIIGFAAIFALGLILGLVFLVEDSWRVFVLIIAAIGFPFLTIGWGDEFLAGTGILTGSLLVFSFWYFAIVLFVWGATHSSGGSSGYSGSYSSSSSSWSGSSGGYSGGGGSFGGGGASSSW